MNGSPVFYAARSAEDLSAGADLDGVYGGVWCGDDFLMLRPVCCSM